MDMKAGSIPAERQKLVDQTMARVAEIERTRGVTRESVNMMKDELMKLAQNKHLFVVPEEFKPTQRGTFKDFVAYRLNKDDGSPRSLYVSLALPGKSSPPHNHNNWAILVGLDGVETNKLYRVDAKEGFKQIEQVDVGPGVGMALMGEDIHSIHVQGRGDEPVWQLRFYERALEAQTDRVQFDENGNTELFPPNPNTRDAVLG